MPTTQKPKRKKEQRFEARISPETKALIQEAADIQGRSVTDFVIASAVEAANRIVATNQFIDLSYRDRVMFFEAVLNPPPPNENLLRAAKRHRQIFPK